MRWPHLSVRMQLSKRDYVHPECKYWSPFPLRQYPSKSTTHAMVIPSHDLVDVDELHRQDKKHFPPSTSRQQSH